MVTWSEQTYRAKLARKHYAKSNRKTGGQSPGAYNQLQEQQAPGSRKARDKAGIPRVDAKMRGRFRVSITLFVSDNRERDADGALATLLDCMCHAAKRLSEEHS